MLKFSKFIFCPHCASKNIVEQTEKSMECCDCGFVYFHNSAIAVATLIEKEGKILLCRRAFDPGKGKLDLPGGFVDYHESLEDALKREAKEELNVDIKNIKYFSSSSNTYLYKGITYFPTDVFFTCEIASNYVDMKVADDVAEFMWLALKDINLDDIAFESVKKMLKLYSKKL